MRTNIVLDDRLMAAAMRASGLKTKRAVVEDALQLYVRIKRQTGIRRLRGKVEFEGSVRTRRLSRIKDR